MKKLIPLLSALLVLAMLAGCGSPAASAASEASQAASAASAAAEASVSAEKAATAAEEAAVPETSAAEEPAVAAEEASDAETENTTAASVTKSGAASAAKTDDGGTWAVYMYVCASDLESKWGCATANIAALQHSALTSDTTFVLETGGTTEWQNDVMSADNIERWVVKDNLLDRVETLDQADMGEEETLADFLTFASTNYPADHTMVILWDHGGGTLSGCCCDDNYQNAMGYDDCLTITEIHKAFESVYDLSEENPPVDIVGFDCCLMATVDIADTLKDVAHYMVASEESEPGLGWDYDGIGGALGENPTMSAEELGTTICDTYYSRLLENDQAYAATLSLTDLTKIPLLTDAFGDFVDEMLVDAYNDPEDFLDYAEYANNTEHYDINIRNVRYRDLIDIKNFVENASEKISCSDAVLKALDQCVLYKVRGEYRSEGGGLSFYYDFGGIEQYNEAYDEYGTIDGLKALYDYGVSDKLSKEEREYVENLGLDPDAIPEIKTFQNYDFGHCAIQLNKDGVAYTDFGSEVSQCAVRAFYRRYAWVGDTLYLLGSDDEIRTDLSTGIVTDNSANNWGYIDGNLCYMQLDYACDDYNLYDIPVLYEGDRMMLQVGYSYTDEEWYVLGFRNPTDDLAVTNRAISFDEGTEFTLLYYIDDGYGNLSEEEGPTFKYTEDCFAYKAMADGEYGMDFVISDLYDNWAYSKFINYTLKDGVRTYE